MYEGGNPWYFYPGDGTTSGVDLLVDPNCPGEVVEQMIAISMGVFPDPRLGAGKYGDVFGCGEFAFKSPGGLEGNPVQSYGFGANSLAVNDAVEQALVDNSITWGGCNVTGVKLRAAWLPPAPRSGRAPVWAMDFVEGIRGDRLADDVDTKGNRRDYSELGKVLCKTLGKTGLSVSSYSLYSLDIADRNIIYDGKGTATKIDSMAADGTYQDATTYLQWLERTQGLASS